jgi:hypothetical protein
LSDNTSSVLTVYVKNDLRQMIEDLKKNRGDLTLGSTVRFLLFKGLASMSYLAPEKKKALESIES